MPPTIIDDPTSGTAVLMHTQRDLYNLKSSEKTYWHNKQTAFERMLE